jgi:hypothetical protein
MTPAPPPDDSPAPVDLETALTQLVWSDPSLVDDPDAALTRLGMTMPEGLTLDVRLQQPDTLYFVIPPAASDGGDAGGVVNQMDLWRSGEQFVWIMSQDAKVALLELREQFRTSRGEVPR